MTVECAERGQALALLRQRYHALLTRVPPRVLHMHEELVATRTLARRILGELERFRDAATELAADLGAARDDSTALGQESQRAAVRL